LKADEFIISKKGSVIKRPPLRDENSDFWAFTTFRRFLVFITASSPMV
jgi:hypothetical protein